VAQSLGVTGINWCCGCQPRGQGGNDSGNTARGFLIGEIQIALQLEVDKKMVGKGRYIEQQNRTKNGA